ncbi:uncharacterized protein [Typha latifolia]|uniref:uncharacterized protein n=1 Tax=Typha latifolia TaxID=4733 RepID=UPI003C304373
MEMFRKAKAVRLKSRHNKYLFAEEDEHCVIQDREGSSRSARWTVEAVPGDPQFLRLKSRFGKYLTASGEPFLLGVTGRKVLQTLPDRLDSSLEWEPIRDGMHVKLRTRYGNYLRANGGLPPWRNTVTHDVPHRTATQDWVFWDVEIVEIVVSPAPDPSPPPRAVPVRVASRPLTPVASLSPAPDPSPPTPPRAVPVRVASRPPVASAPLAPVEVSSLPEPPLAATKLSKLESLVSFSAPLRKVEGRTIYYAIVGDDDGEDVDEAIESYSLTFNGTSLVELTRLLEVEIGIDGVIICTRNPFNGKLCPLRLQLPPNNATMHIVVVPESSKVARTFRRSYGS